MAWRGNFVTRAQDMHRHRLDGRFAAYSPVLLMAHGDDRDDDFLQHGTTVNEACTTREMKAAGPLGIQNSMPPSATAVTRVVPCQVWCASGKSWLIR